MIKFLYCKFTADCDDIRILEIGQDLVKLWQKIKWHLFFRTRYISADLITNRNCDVRQYIS